MQSPPTSENAVDPLDSFDPSRPFHGLVLCCTNIEADQRTEIAQRTADMGGVHKYDLTPDVTHLIVGDYNTPKYRHVAKERPDIKPMAAAWVEAVRQLWVEDQEIDFAALESNWRLRTFESGGGTPNSPDPNERERQRLVCCLTGFEDNNVRAMIEDKVRANGGEYVADLSRRVTHLIVAKPEGKKYSAARRWDIRCVSIEWLHDSVERGMILQEECYDPTLPPEERGKGAWSRKDLGRIPLGKRPREESLISADGGRRKLRKSASMRMNSQKNNIWGDILNTSASDLSRQEDMQRESSAPAAPVVANPVTSATKPSQTVAQPPNDEGWPALRKGVFSGCRFFVHGFPEPRQQVLFGFLTSYDGTLASSLEDVASSHHNEPSDQRYLLVPQMSQPDSHPQLPEGVHIITEFFVERCIHNKHLFSPTDHVLGQPFPRFPIDGFQNLTICTTGFINEQLNQIEKTITQLGATYSEKLHRQISLLLCPDLRSLREQKRDLALYHNILIINVEWLWQCIATGCLVPWDRFQFDELVQKADAIRANLKRKEEHKHKEKGALNRTRSEPAPAKPPVAKSSHRGPAPPLRAGVDTTAFDSDVTGARRESSSLRGQGTRDSHYVTAPTHPRDFEDAFTTAPLAETTASNLNKPVSPPKEAQQQSDETPKRFSTQGEIGDSDAGEESDATVTRTRPSKEPHAAAAAAAAATCDSEVERKRKAQQAKDLERLELSKRLNSLMANNSNNDESPQEGGATGGGGGGGKGDPPPAARRKRQILGRATSNVSAASSASADSATATGGARMRLSGSVQSVVAVGSATTTTAAAAAAAAATTTGGSEFDKFLEPAADGHREDDAPPPPSTQLEYEDPEARRQRQVVVGKMMGRGKQATATAMAAAAAAVPEKLRLSDLRASADQEAAGGGGGSGAGGAAGRRGTRSRNRN